MIKLDKLKIVSDIINVEVITPELFVRKMQNGTVMKEIYRRKTPSHLYIELDYISGQVIIEFTGKILLQHYAQLINQGNISECL